MKRITIAIFTLALCLSTVAFGAETTSPFNGKDLKGWVTDPASITDHWKAEDGMIVGENLDKKGSVLWTTKKYTDFDLSVDYMTPSPDYDSGVFARGTSHQVQIGVSRSLKIDLTACIYAPKDKAGSYPARSDKVKAVHKLGKWNTLRIVVQGKRIQTWLNKKPFVDYIGKTIPADGPIGLQLHPGVHMKMCFKNLKMKDLSDDEGFEPLFNGKDLTGWIPPKGEHSWKVIDGVLDYEAKGGNLVTAKQYEDYTLRFEWRFKRTEGGTYAATIFNPDGTAKKDENGKVVTLAIPNADSGIFTRGIAQTQVNLWCWPCGSGQLWAYMNNKYPKIQKGALPMVKADKPVGKWNKMEITMCGEAIKAVLNGKVVIDTLMPGAPTKGPITLQHHGGYNEKTKKWNSASALIQFRNIAIKELKK